MKLIKAGICIFCITICGQSKAQESQWPIKITARATNWSLTSADGKVKDGEYTLIINLRSAGSKQIASENIREELVFSKNGTLEKTIYISEPKLVEFTYRFQRGLIMTELTVPIYKQGVLLEFDGAYPKCKGSYQGVEDKDLIDRFQAVRSESNTDPKMIQLRERFKNNSYDKQLSAALTEQINALQLTYDKKAAELLKNRKTSLAVIMLAAALDSDHHLEVKKEVAKQALIDWPQYNITKDFAQDVDNNDKVSAGKTLPELELPDLKGKSFRISSVQGRPLLLHIATDTKSLKKFAELKAKLSQKKLEIIYIVANAEDLSEFRYLIPDPGYPVLFDYAKWSELRSLMFMPKQWPFSIIVGADGRIQKRLGGQTADALENELNLVLK